MEKHEPNNSEQESMSDDIQMETAEDLVSTVGDESNEDELADSTDRFAVLEQEVGILRDRVLRQAAEFQNYRRRVEQERQSDVKFGQSLVLQQLLDVYDDLQRSVEAAEEAVKDESVDTEVALSTLLGGVELVFKKFTDELQRFGVEPIEAIGTAFNEEEHEAMMQQPAPEGTPAGVVLSEIQKGFRMGNRVLRHSKVVVSG